MPLDSERLYVDLLFRASKKYASWDPEVAVEVGDWGQITRGRTGLAFWRKRQGTFLKEGNIYQDGKAKTYEIPAPKESGLEASEGINYIVSQNAEELEITGSIASQTPALAQCKFKAGFKFSSNQGALLVMNNDTITTIDPPGRLRALLSDNTMANKVVVSEVHKCSSYARLLTAKGSRNIVIGLQVEPPVSGAASAALDATWVRNSTAGNYKSKVNKNGGRVFYPLFRLVSVKEQDTSVGFRGDGDNLVLPDAEPPWMLEESQDRASPDTQSSRATSFTKSLIPKLGRRLDPRS